MPNSQIVQANQSIAHNTVNQSPANTTRTTFKVKPIEYFDGFSDRGIVKSKGGERYGELRIKSNKVTILWDDEKKPDIYPSLEVAQNWGLIEPVPWFIPGKTVVMIPLPDGTLNNQCLFLVEAADEMWLELVGIDGTYKRQPERTAKYPIAQLPGFPVCNLVELKPQPLLPIPVSFELKHKAGMKLWNIQLIEAIGRKAELFAEFREEFADLSTVETEFTLAWEDAWQSYLTRTAKLYGHGGKKIGMLVFIEGAIETIESFDTETFDFVTDKGTRLHLLKLYLYPLLEVANPIPNLFILKAGDYREARVGFNNKEKAKKQEAKIKRLSGCKEISLTSGTWLTGFSHEYVLHNPYTKSVTFEKHLIDLANKLRS